MTYWLLKTELTTGGYNSYWVKVYLSFDCRLRQATASDHLEAKQ